ncbi:MAG TPA: GNAT family N-acetyltransferase [Chthoniobacterales bacterium]
MDETLILRLLDEERRHLNDSDVTLSPTRYVVRAVGAQESWAGIVYYCFPAEETESVIEGEIAFFENLGREFEWKVYSHDQPQDLLAELRRRGFKIGEEEALMIRELRELPISLTAASSGITVAAVTNAQGVNDFLAVEAELWPASEKMRHWLLTILKDPAQQDLAFVAYEDRIPIGCGRVSVRRESRFAGLWGGAVLPAFRGKGVYRALLAARIKHVSKFDSVQYLRVDALPTSRPILEKYGFQRVGSTWPAEWAPPRREGKSKKEE